MRLTFDSVVTAIILIAVFRFPAADCFDCDKDPVHREGQLKKGLLCGSYDSSKRPVKDPKYGVNVSVTPILMSFDYDDQTNTLEANLMLVMKWFDEYLVWNPQTYDNITTIVLDSADIWLPDFQLFSSTSKQDSKYSCTNPRSQIGSDGGVFSVPACDFTAQCEADYSNWPMDSQKCTLQYGAWTESLSEVDFFTKVSWLASKQTNQHIKWQVVSTKVSKVTTVVYNNATYPIIRYEYVIERHASSHLAGLLTPIFVVVFLNLFLTWLNTECIERKLLLVLSLFCHFQLLIQLQWTVPKNADTVPGILIFFRNSMIITCLLLVHTMFGTALKRLENTPPSIVILLAGSVGKNKIGELILAGDYLTVEYKKFEIQQQKNTELIENRKAWISFSKILDRVFFILFLLSYVTFFILYVPLKYARLSDYELNVLDFNDNNQIDE